MKIKAAVFPFENVDCNALLNELAGHTFIVRYESQGIKCIWIPKFSEHQKPHPREAQSKLPCFSTAGPCNYTDAPGFFSDSLILNPSNLNPPASAGDSCSEVAARPSKHHAEDSARNGDEAGKLLKEHRAEKAIDPKALHVYPVFGTISSRRSGTTSWKISDELIAKWISTFPAVNVEAECRRAHAWVSANWSKRKTVGGMEDFLFRWLSKEQNVSRVGSAARHEKPSVDIASMDLSKKDFP